MKRDLELIRKIILRIEGNASARAGRFDGPEFEGYTAYQFGYHAYLIVESGLATGFDVSTLGNPGPVYQLSHLTPKGHDFAESCRNEFIWDEAKSKVEEQGLMVASVDTMKKLLDKLIRKKLDIE